MNIKRGIVLLVRCPLTYFLAFILGGGSLAIPLISQQPKAEAFATFLLGALLFLLLIMFFIYSFDEGGKR